MERDRTRLPPGYPPQDQHHGPPPNYFEDRRRFPLGDEDLLPPPQFKTYIAPSARTLLNPPPREKPYKPPQTPREKPFLMNAGNALFSASVASFFVYPFIRARELLSINPDTPSMERTRRYMFGLRQIISSQGTKVLIKGYSFYAAMIPAITLDLAIFYSLKKRMYPLNYYHEMDIPWIGNIHAAGTATIIRYVVLHPFSDTYLRVNAYSAKLRPGDFAKEILRFMKYRFQTLGFKGIYEGAAKKLPVLVLFRGIQLGTCETMFQRIKYEKGHISWIQKFICCWGITAIAKYLIYPFEVAREQSSRAENQSGKPVKNYLDAFVKVFTQANIQTFKRATSKALRASGGALTLSIFFHVTDESHTNGFF